MRCSAESRRRNPTADCAGANVGLSPSVGATALSAALCTLLAARSLTLRCWAPANDERSVDIVAVLYLLFTCKRVRPLRHPRGARIAVIPPASDKRGLPEASGRKGARAVGVQMSVFIGRRTLVANRAGFAPFGASDLP